jgi:ubiquinone/menaquinone biosynthesis C-methylase UbiE
MLVRNVIKNRSANKQFLESHPDFIPPPYHLAYDAYNHTNWKAYNDMGRTHSRLISELINKYVEGKEIAICEWGCGPARVIRHLSKIDGFNRVERHGTDYNNETIEWCDRCVEDVTFSVNKLFPPLQYPSEKFDCVYAISIFTHLSEQLHYAWMKELFRVIKRNGILIFTTHGDICTSRLSPKEKSEYESGNLVVRDKIKEGKKHFSSYQPHKFIKEKLLNGIPIIEHMRDPAKYGLQQEVWVVRKE